MIYWTAIFTIFSPNGRYFCEYCQSGPGFPIPQGTLPWQPLGKIGKMTFIQHCGILEWIGISQYG